MIYKDKKIIWIFLLPTIVLVSLFLYIPFFASIWNSLFNITDMAGINKTWVGLDNYVELFRDPIAHTSFKNTFIIMALTIIFELGLGFLLAILVDTVRRGKKIYQTVFFFPVVISATAIGLMFTLFYNLDMGLFNQVLKGMGFEPIYWLEEGRALYSIATPIVWQYVGFYFVIFLTGIAGIPEDIYESAYLDGINGWKKVLYITIPLLKGVIKSSLILVITGTLKIFDLAWIIAPRGAPFETTYLFGTYQYKTVYEAWRIGYGCTIAVVIVVLGMIISLVVNKLLKAEEM